MTKDSDLLLARGAPATLKKMDGFVRFYGTVSGYQNTMKRAYIAFGSNLGDRLKNIEAACRELQADKDIVLMRTSGLWQTRAMYMTDQNDFLNGVCEIETTLPALELLDRLQAIENKLGRERLVEKGPRTLDLDVLLYGDEAIANERLVVPHKLMLERHFVLEPLCQLIPSERPQAAVGGETDRTFSQHLNHLGPPSDTMSPIAPMSESLGHLEPLMSSRKTHVMSILNVTPDSFSDGGMHSAADAVQLRQTLHNHLSEGATIIDIGGQSTRPHADTIGGKEEIARVLPAIKAARELLDDPTTPFSAAISIDTYRSEVARVAVEAGAGIVNDISGGTLDPKMLETVADLGCTVVLMHMRGTPETMTSKENTTYDGDLVEVVGNELLSRVRAAEEVGIFRWRIILDPGIGFAKTAAQNLELLRRFGELRDFAGLRGLPWVVGASRKGFIGKVTGVKEAAERSWGTAATVAASIQGGADIVRVHDVDEMSKVTKMSDAIWRA